MVDTTIIDEISDIIKKRGRPKKIKTVEELEEDRLKKNNYHNNYHKNRCEKDAEYAQKTRNQNNARVKRYTDKNKETIKMKRDEIVRKSELYDEVLKSMSEIKV